jgi:hypothetical protein
MPLYRNVSADGYTSINPNDGRRANFYPSEHRYVYECSVGPIPPDKHVHHIDGNFRNHTPSNLELVDPPEHQSMHIASMVGKATCVNCGADFMQNMHWQKHCSAKCRQQYADSRRKLKVTNRFCERCGKIIQRPVAAQKYCSVTCRGYAYRSRRGTPNNHRVISVEFYGYEDVFNMEVENDHNFCANGVFVHNCDDHMMENLYRILLLNTQYTRPEEEDGEGEDYRDRVNESTGY